MSFKLCNKLLHKINIPSARVLNEIHPDQISSTINHCGTVGAPLGVRLDDWFAAQATIQSSCCHSFSSNSSYTVTATPMPARLRPHLALHIFGANGILTQISCIASQCQDQKLDPRHFANFPTWKWRIGGEGGAARWEVVRVTAKAIWLSWSGRRRRS